MRELWRGCEGIVEELEIWSADKLKLENILLFYVSIFIYFTTL